MPEASTKDAGPAAEGVLSAPPRAEGSTLDAASPTGGAASIAAQEPQETRAPEAGLLPPRVDLKIAGWAPQAASSATPGARTAEADAPIPLAPPVASEHTPGWAGAAELPLAPEDAALLVELEGDLGNHPAAAAQALLAAGPQRAAAALVALAGQGPLEATLAGTILAAMATDARDVLLPAIAGHLPPEARAEVLSPLVHEALASPRGARLEGEAARAPLEPTMSAGEGPRASLEARRTAGGITTAGEDGRDATRARSAAPGMAPDAGPARHDVLIRDAALRAFDDPAPRAAALSPVLDGALAAHAAARLSMAAGGDAAAVALGAALGGLAKLLHGDPADGKIVVNDVFEPKAAYVLGQHEDRGGAGDGRSGPNDQAQELMEALRSLDFAGLKAVALDRAAARLAKLRSEDAREALLRARESAARLLASDPAGIARFGRERPDVFPRSSARNVLGELLRADEPPPLAAITAAFGHLASPVASGGDCGKAFAAGYLGSAGAVASEGISAAEGALAPGRALAATLAVGLSLAQAIGASPGGSADRDFALVLLDRYGPEIERGLAEQAAIAAIGASDVRGWLTATFAAREGAGEDGLLRELEAGLGS